MKLNPFLPALLLLVTPCASIAEAKDSRPNFILCPRAGSGTMEASDEH